VEGRVDLGTVIPSDNVIVLVLIIMTLKCDEYSKSHLQTVDDSVVVNFLGHPVVVGTVLLELKCGSYAHESISTCCLVNTDIEGELLSIRISLLVELRLPIQ